MPRNHLEGPKGPTATMSTPTTAVSKSKNGDGGPKTMLQKIDQVPLTAQLAQAVVVDQKPKEPPRKPHLPILIVPGFMSSGLQVKQSSLHPSWVGERLWLNLMSLGLGGFFTGSKTTNATRLNKILDASDADNVIDSSHQPRPTADGNVAEGEALTDEDAHLALHRSMFLKHMSLTDDMQSEHPDVEVRALEGLTGVDYLTPGALTNHVSYVFGPVIKALKRVGYKEGFNLDAAPYDWRLPPTELERRDQYFTRTMRTVENLYENTKIPVVILCHSLGSKVGHYFLDFAHSKDKTWCKKYVHTYMPVGAPHLGAPKALRANITGDKMGLDAFLSDNEALAMGRSFGSGMWLVPSKLPPFVPANVYVRREGAFKVTIKSTINIRPLIEQRLENPKPIELVLRYGEKVLTTKFVEVEGQTIDVEGVFTFSTGPDGPFAKSRCQCCCNGCVLCCVCCACCSNNNLFVSLREKGLKTAKGTKKGAQVRKNIYSENDKCVFVKILFCWYIVKWFLVIFGTILYFVVFRIWVLLGDCINRASDRSAQIATSEPIRMEEFVGDTEGRDVTVELRDDFKNARCCRREMDVVPTLTINVKWIPADMKSNEHSNMCQIAEVENKKARRIGTLIEVHDKEMWDYEGSSGFGILKNEKCDAAISTVSTLYDSDPLRPRTSTSAPPVNNVKAIYGINLPTEVGAVYRRRKAIAERKNKVKSMYKLDQYARLDSVDGYVLDKGILMETKETPQMISGPKKLRSSTSIATDFSMCSGDGTVPYWSLQHCRTWEQDCNVSISEIDGAEHRAILADSRFHNILIDYCTVKEDNAENQV